MSGLRTSAIGSGVPSSVSSFLILSAGDLRRAEVGHRSGHHDDVGPGGRCHHGLLELQGAPGPDHRAPRGIGQLDVGADQRHRRPAGRRCRGQRVALQAAGPVAEEPHRVQGLAGPARADHDAQPGQVADGRRCAGRRRRPRRSSPARASDRARCRHRSAGRRPGPARSRRARAGWRRWPGWPACSHISVCMAGTITTGQVAVSRVAVSRSSARPVAARDRRSAVAGATTTMSADLPRRTCSTPSTSSQTVVCTGWPDSAAHVAAPTKFRADSVGTTRTSWPDSVSRRSRWAAL